MKNLGSAFFLLVTLGISHAFCAPFSFSASANVTAAGSAGASANWGGGEDSYSEAKAVVSTGSLAASVSGSASWDIENQPDFSSPPNSRSNSQANVDMVFAGGANAFDLSVTAGAAAENYAFVGGPVMHAYASASPFFSATFVIDQLTFFSLDLITQSTRGHGFVEMTHIPSFSLSSVDASFNLTQPDVGHPSMRTMSTGGTLQPGHYTLQYSSTAAVYGDPLGDFEYQSMTLNFSAQHVPETGGTLVLLGAAFTGLCAFSLRRRRQ